MNKYPLISSGEVLEHHRLFFYPHRISAWKRCCRSSLHPRQPSPPRPEFAQKISCCTALAKTVKTSWLGIYQTANCFFLLNLTILLRRYLLRLIQPPVLSSDYQHPFRSGQVFLLSNFDFRSSPFDLLGVLSLFRTFQPSLVSCSLGDDAEFLFVIFRCFCCTIRRTRKKCLISTLSE